MDADRIYTINTIKELKGIAGIYKLSFYPSSHFYIGSSNNLYNRFKYHISRLRRNIHDNGALRNACNKYSIDKLQINILEVCPVDILIEREQYYIDTLHPNYNIAKSAKGGITSILSSEDVLNIREKYFNRTCIQDIEELANSYGLSFDYIRKIANQAAMTHISNTKEVQDLIDSNKGKNAVPSHLRKLSRDQVGMIRWAIANNKSTEKLTKAFKIDGSAVVRRIKANKIYKEYTELVDASQFNLPDKQVSKLTDYQIAQVKWAHSKNIPHRKISEYFGCHYNTSCDIKMGRVYKYITELIPCEELLT